jgi:hypothetical protein
MANLGDGGAVKLFPFQMGAAGLTIISGLWLWVSQLGAAFNTHEKILLLGIAAAIVAAAIQGSLIGRARRALGETSVADAEPIIARIATVNRIAASLLLITVACMIGARLY